MGIVNVVAFRIVKHLSVDGLSVVGWVLIQGFVDRLIMPFMRQYLIVEDFIDVYTAFSLSNGQM